MDFLTNITQYYIPIVVIACLIVGYCIKHISWLEKVSNEYIPLVMVILGGVLGCLANGEITLITVVSGALSGLASTGLHQVFKQIIESNKTVTEEVKEGE